MKLGWVCKESSKAGRKNEKIDGGGWRAKEGDVQVAAEFEETETEEEEQREATLPNFSPTRETAKRA